MCFSVHWPLLAGCGSQCQPGPSRVQQPPRCHTARRSSAPQRSPSQSPHLFAHTELYFAEQHLHWLPPAPKHCHLCVCVRAIARWGRLLNSSFALSLHPAPFPPHPPISFSLIKPHLLTDYAASPHHCHPSPPSPNPPPPPPPLILPFTSHNLSHRGQVQISPWGGGFWVFRQRYYLTC